MSEMSQKLIFSTDLEARLRQEVRLLEGNNEKLEQKIEALMGSLEEKKENIGILEKSISQKDKFNAIILKEKERLMKTTPFEGLMNTKKKEMKVLQINNNNKENYKKLDNKAKNISQQENNEDLETFKQKLKGADLEIERLKKENFELLVRLKNKKN